jgi:hypothetical protein
MSPRLLRELRRYDRLTSYEAVVVYDADGAATWTEYHLVVPLWNWSPLRRFMGAQRIAVITRCYLDPAAEIPF